MKLEIKHIAPYLPYGINAEILNYKCNYVGRKYDLIVGLHQWSDDGLLWSTIMKNGSTTSLSDLKLVLRPLSDIQNYKVQLKALGYRTDNDAISDIISDISQCVAEYKIMLFLFENHFDWQDLIGQGLAVDINTLTQN